MFKMSFLFCRLQDSDGGFFEKFGSLLRQKTVNEENDLKTSLAPMEGESLDEEENTQCNEKVDASEDNECASGQTIDLEPEANMSEIKERKEQFFEKSVGMNVSFNIHNQVF